MIDPRTEISNRLRKIEDTFGVEVIFACEAGSRAWGFDSPDSDWDVRFVFKRRPEDYITYHKVKDVIDRSMLEKIGIWDDKFDFAGWDVIKAFGLFRKSNPTFLEWLRSPILYRESAAFEEITGMVPDMFDPKASYYHYLNMARRDILAHHMNSEVSYKKYLYMVRCLLAVEYVLKFNEPIPVPMEDLLRCIVPEENPLFTEVMRLIEMKKNGAELGKGRRIVPISTWIEEMLSKYENDGLGNYEYPSRPDGKLLRLLSKTVLG